MTYKAQSVIVIIQIKERTAERLKGGNKMKELRNSFDKDLSFTSVEKAKEYFYPSEKLDESIKDLKNYDEFNGDLEEFENFLEQWAERKNAISLSQTLEELADALNQWTDTFDNGSRYSVRAV